MKRLLLIISIFQVAFVFAQNSKFTLDDCMNNAIENHPDFKQTGLNNAILQLNIKNAKTNYYPLLNLNGQMHYQSDVTKIHIPASLGFTAPEISNDWYNINLDVNQVIYDGGVISGTKNVLSAENEVANQSVQVELYKLKENISNLFFNIIFLQKNIEVIDVLINSLNANIANAEKAYENGVMLKADVDKLKVELHSAYQQKTEKESDVKAVIGSLNEITKLQVTSPDDLVLPSVSITDYSFINNRPEYILMNKQQLLLDATSKLTSSQRRPVFSAFGQVGYGRPGYDMLNNDFMDYYKIGLRIYWNIWDWNKTRNDRKIIDIRREIIDTKKQTIDQNLRADLIKRVENINKYNKLLESDNEIVKLQSNVVATTDAQFKNGTVTTTTYLIELNKLAKAQLNAEAHKLQLIYARYQYLTAIGNL